MNNMQGLRIFWRSFKRLPCALLLALQGLMLLLALFSNYSQSYRIVTWVLGLLVLLVIAKVIRQTPVFTILGLSFVVLAILFSFAILMGLDANFVQVMAHIFEACAYFCAVYGLVRYMFEDRYLTLDELFAVGAVFTLLAWGFAFLYSACQLFMPGSFSNSNTAELQNWLDLLFLSFSLQSATGLSDIIPTSPLAKVLAMLQMFCGVMYLAIIVSRLIALQYVRHPPKH